MKKGAKERVIKTLEELEKQGRKHGGRPSYMMRYGSAKVIRRYRRRKVKKISYKIQDTKRMYFNGLKSFLPAFGCVTDIAATLGCHRDTVSYSLRKPKKHKTELNKRIREAYLKYYI